MKTILSIDTDWVQDQRTFNLLLEVVAPIFKKISAKKISFSSRHKDIHLITESLNKSELPLRIVNIDHHHDIQYFSRNPQERDETVARGFFSSNWLGHYILGNVVKEVLWISNYTSVMNGFQDARNKLDNECIKITQDINQVKLYEYDYIFVCQSPHHANTHSFCAYETLLIITKNYV